MPPGWNRRLSLPRSETHLGQLVNSVRRSVGGWESIEMVRRYAHLAPNHLTEHAKQIDSIFSDDVPNMSHLENKELAENG